MANKDDVLAALKPVLELLATVDASQAEAAARLEAAFPVKGPAMAALRAMVREGVEARWLCEKESGAVRFGRLAKAAQGFSVDVVHLGGAGAAHTHPSGEFDLCFAVAGQPRFDGRPEGWTAYGAGTWHVPTVEGGAMDILYFLPGGAMRFEPRPPGATAVGLQATGR